MRRLIGSRGSSNGSVARKKERQTRHLDAFPKTTAGLPVKVLTDLEVALETIRSLGADLGNSGQIELSRMARGYRRFLLPKDSTGRSLKGHLILFGRFLANDEAWRSIRLFLSGRSDEMQCGQKFARQLEARARR